ncbi:MAG TPA: cyclic-di-AMP receptor [Chloroflexota bacterium]|nr:cyclic-di-AMP receptor [Chloroflexota bacterium]
MKLILCITREGDANRLIERLIEQEFRATRIPTSGGFLKRGNSTVVVGVEDYHVDAVLQVARDTAAHANVFVLDVARYERL